MELILVNYELIYEVRSVESKRSYQDSKTDLAWQALSGGKFGLTKWDGLNWARVDGAQEVDITSKDGNNIPVGLEPGLYRLQELASSGRLYRLTIIISISLSRITSMKLRQHPSIRFPYLMR